MKPEPFKGRPALESILSRDSTEETEFTTGVARSGERTVQVKNVWVHSTVAPAREGAKLAAAWAESAEGADCVVVFGYGLGYAVDALALRMGDVELFIVEPAPRIVLDLVPEPPPLEFWGVDDVPHLLRHLQESGRRKPAFVSGRAFQQLFKDEWRRTAEAIASYRDRTLVNRNTIRRFGRTWVRNMLRTAVSGTDVLDLNVFDGVFSGMPSIVVAAGPTLDELLPILPGIAARTLVIAVETAASRVRTTGVTPDFVVTVDPQYWNTRHVDRVDRTSPILVTEPAAHPRSVRLWQGPVAMAESVFPLGRELWGSLGARNRLGAGGSVATSAWDLARFVGSTEIYLVGVDLAFPGNATHCRETFYDQFVRSIALRRKPAETFKHALLGEASPHRVSASDGTDVLSDRRMLVYRTWFEDQLTADGAPSTYVTSPLSSRIEGANVANLSEWVSLNEMPERRDEIDRIRDGAICNATRSRVEPSVISALTDAIATIEERALQAVAECDRVVSTDVSPEDLARVDQLDAQLLADENRHVVGFLLSDEADLAVSERAVDATSSIRQSAAIHRAVAESARYHIDLIERFAAS